MVSNWCPSSNLCKGLFTLVLILVALEFFFGVLIQYRAENLKTINTARQMNVQRLLSHHPIEDIDKIEGCNATKNGTEPGLSDRASGTDNSLPICRNIPLNLTGQLKVVKSPVPTISELEKQFGWLKPGGRSHPVTCQARQKVAIIIPFRCRDEHLLLFMQHMHPFLGRQQIDYRIFVVEQAEDGPFNRGMLMNVGYKEALKFDNFHCFILHDIDLLPEDDRNLYNCPEQPLHMSVAVDTFDYKLPYDTIFGGVSAVSKEHFELVNGFSNSYWGWGNEDDDMWNRILYHKLRVMRYPLEIAKYTMLAHKKSIPSPIREEVYRTAPSRYRTDGLNSLKYTILDVKENVLYTWLLVKLKSPS